MASFSLRQCVEKRWYDGSPGWLFILSPLEKLYAALASRHKTKSLQQQETLPVPTVIVGNISVGGTGKTPVLIALVKRLLEEGWRPGVVSRGYGRSTKGIQAVTDSSSIDDVGDEPKEIFEKTRCPVYVGSDRVAAAKQLLNAHSCDVLLCDDGMQHYRLGRHIELAVVDRQRLLGNRHRLPLGPLREPAERLNNVTWVILSGGANGNAELAVQELMRSSALTGKALEEKTYVAQVVASHLVNIRSEEQFPLSDMKDKEDIAAVAGIGNPQKFFNTLSENNIAYSEHVFPDHHRFIKSDFDDFAGRTVVMTHKDAVKCRAFADDNWWSLQVEMKLDGAFLTQFFEKLETLKASIAQH